MKSRLVLLCLIAAVSAVQAKESSPTLENIRAAPGDDKTDYEHASYTTDSLSIALRKGRPAELDRIAREPQLGLPALSKEVIGSIDNSKIQLGRKLFFDRRLSGNKTMSCAMCHIPEQGFTSNELARPIGFEGRGLKRNAPTILNIAFSERLFWDARESQLAQQVWAPLLAANEMNNPSIGAVIDLINSDPEYPALFQKAFGQTANMINVGEAIAQYERSLIAGNSRFDQWRYGKRHNALSKDEIAGYQLFTNKARCSSCHTISSTSALFTDQRLHNTGLGYSTSMSKQADTVTVQLAPGVTAEMKRSVIQSVGEKKPNDLGHYEVSNDPRDRWKFKTPSLRNVALTAPYMHDGSFTTLEQVIDFYNKGGVNHDLLSPLIRPLNLSETEQNSLVLFLKTLTGSNIKTLIADGFAAPIGDTGQETKN